MINDCGCDKKYEVSCSLLQGFECCRCCGIIECEEDVCPENEKIKSKKSLTAYEFRILAIISDYAGDVERARNAFVEKRYLEHYHYEAGVAQLKLKQLLEEVMTDENLTERVRYKATRNIHYALKSCDILCYYYLSVKNKKFLRKTPYNYIKRNIAKISSKCIAKHKLLCKNEKIKLLAIKGVKNPLSYLYSVRFNN